VDHVLNQSGGKDTEEKKRSSLANPGHTRGQPSEFVGSTREAHWPAVSRPSPERH